MQPALALHLATGGLRVRHKDRAQSVPIAT